MPGGKAVITITPTPGEPAQFDLTVADSIPLAGSSIVAVVWVVPLPGFPAYANSGVTIHNEFDYSPTPYTYTAQAAVLFSDGSVDVALKTFDVPHGVN